MIRDFGFVRDDTLKFRSSGSLMVEFVCQLLSPDYASSFRSFPSTFNEMVLPLLMPLRPLGGRWGGDRSGKRREVAGGVGFCKAASQCLCWVPYGGQHRGRGVVAPARARAK